MLFEIKPLCRATCCKWWSFHCSGCLDNQLFARLTIFSNRKPQRKNQPVWGGVGTQRRISGHQGRLHFKYCLCKHLIAEVQVSDKLTVCFLYICFFLFSFLSICFHSFLSILLILFSLYLLFCLLSICCFLSICSHSVFSLLLFSFLSICYCFLSISYHSVFSLCVIILFSCFHSVFSLSIFIVFSLLVSCICLFLSPSIYLTLQSFSLW